MTQILTAVLHMSFSACWIILAVAVLRLFMKKAPKNLSVLMWIPVALRLCLPFSVNSIYSLLPQTITPTATGMTTVTAVGTTIVSAVDTVAAPSAQAGLSVREIAAMIWGVGVVLMLGYMLISHIRLRGKLRHASPLWGNIHTVPGRGSAFVYGIFRPRIYLPDELDETQAGHVIAHEQAHIRRKDHWWKFLGFVILAVHWFNPMVWLAYALLCRDLELACDERVIRAMSNQEKAAYSEALLLCSLTQKGRTAFPVAFSKVSVKSRIKAIVNYKKPTLWVSLAVIAAIAVLSVCFLTDPVQAQQEISSPPVTAEQSSAAEESAVVQRPDVAPEPEPGVTPRWILNPVTNMEDFVADVMTGRAAGEHFEGVVFDAYKILAQKENESQVVVYVAYYGDLSYDGTVWSTGYPIIHELTADIREDGVFWNYGFSMHIMQCFSDYREYCNGYDDMVLSGIDPYSAEMETLWREMKDICDKNRQTYFAEKNEDHAKHIITPVTEYYAVTTKLV